MWFSIFLYISEIFSEPLLLHGSPSPFSSSPKDRLFCLSAARLIYYLYGCACIFSFNAFNICYPGGFFIPENALKLGKQRQASPRAIPQEVMRQIKIHNCNSLSKRSCCPLHKLFQEHVHHPHGHHQAGE